MAMSKMKTLLEDSDFSEEEYDDTINLGNPDLSWIPKSGAIDRFQHYNLDDLDSEEKLNIITINFISHTLVVKITEDDTLFEIKKWLLEKITHKKYNEFNNVYEIDLIFSVDEITLNSTISIQASELINKKITCIIADNDSHLISCNCTGGFHYPSAGVWNIICTGYGCNQGCGFLIPEDIDIFKLSEDIPEQYLGKITDIEWVNFKNRMNRSMELCQKYHIDSFYDFKEFEKEMILKYGKDAFVTTNVSKKDMLKMYYCTKHI
jgi:hypothetical protein